eukprot:snap_masked-scaffold_37-processed-gene-0.2-mRNA-1 protein AED:1.00 eAED:1.00 QI:0/0/0/0/1/1/2/0/235
MELVQKSAQITPSTRNRNKDEEAPSLLGYDKLSLLSRCNWEKNRDKAWAVMRDNESVNIRAEWTKKLEVESQCPWNRENLLERRKYSFREKNPVEPSNDAEGKDEAPQEIGDSADNGMRETIGAADGDDGGDSSSSTRSAKVSWSITGILFRGTNQSISNPAFRFPSPPVAKGSIKNRVPFIQFTLPQKLFDFKGISIGTFYTNIFHLERAFQTLDYKTYYRDKYTTPYNLEELM